MERQGPQVMGTIVSSQSQGSCRIWGLRKQGRGPPPASEGQGVWVCSRGKSLRGQALTGSSSG